MIKKALANIALFQANHPIITILFILALTLIAIVGGSQVKTVAALENMMPPDIDEINSFRLLRDQGLGQDIIAIVISVDKNSAIPRERSVLDKDVMTYIQSISSLSSKNTDVLQIRSPADIFQRDISSLTQEEYDQYIAQSENYLDQFISLDKQTAVVLIFTDVSANDERMILLSNQIRTELTSLGIPSQMKYQLTGTPIIQQKLGVLIGEDRKKTQNISTIFVFIITALIFGSFTTALVPIIVVTISVTWLYGIMGFAGLPISTLAGGVAAMVIGIGIDYSIHIINRYKHQKKTKCIEDSIANAVSHTGYALLGASIATILAFLAFLVGSMPEMGRFGLLMAIGVTLSYILSIFGLPAFLMVEEKLIARFAKKAHFGIHEEYVLTEEKQ